MAGDPAGTVRAAPVVTEWELLDQQHGLAPTGQVIGRGRSHGPRADDHVLRSMRCMGMNSPGAAPINDNAILGAAKLLLGSF